MSNFNEAIKTVLLHERGFSDNPKDAGGATNWGISLRFLKTLFEGGQPIGDIDLDGDVDSDDIRKMPVETAIEIYKKEWWDKYKYGNIYSQLIATKVFDLSVNMGAIQAHKNLQRAIRAVTGQILLDDGILGQKSLKAVNDCNPNFLLPALKSETAGFYRSLKQPTFLKGWLNRAYD